MQYWLFKSEFATFSISDLAHAPNQATTWEGVRNYQARNFLRDDINVGDQAFFYHSTSQYSKYSPPGIVGIIEVVKSGYPDDSAFDPNSRYFDPKSCREKPTWYQVDVRLVKSFTHYVGLDLIKASPELKDMVVARKGNRLSISKVTPDEWNFICFFLSRGKTVEQWW